MGVKFNLLVEFTLIYASSKLGGCSRFKLAMQKVCIQPFPEGPLVLHICCRCCFVPESVEYRFLKSAMKYQQTLWGWLYMGVFLLVPFVGCISRGTTGQPRILGYPAVDGRNPAPPHKPWKIRFPGIYQQHCFNRSIWRQTHTISVGPQFHRFLSPGPAPWPLCGAEVEAPPPLLEKNMGRRPRPIGSA